MRREQAFGRENATRNLSRDPSEYVKGKTDQFGGTHTPPQLNWGVAYPMPGDTAYSDTAGIKLQDGRIVVAGGTKNVLGNELNAASADAFVFDADGYNPAPIDPIPEAGPYRAFLLGDGRAIFIGGSTTLKVFTLDPTSLEWTSQPDIGWHAGRYVVLQNGNLLHVGGNDEILGTPVDFVEEYDQASDTWLSRNPMSEPRDNFSLVLLSTGNVLLSGGESPVSVTEILDVVGDSWTPTAGSLQADNRGFTPFTTSEGRTFLADSNGGFTLYMDEYHPATDQFTPLATGPGGLSVSASSGSQTLFDVGGGFLAMVDRAGGSDNREAYYDIKNNTWFQKSLLYPGSLFVNNVLVQISKNTFFAFGGPEGNDVVPHRHGLYVLISTLREFDKHVPTFAGLVSVEGGTAPDRVVLRWAPGSDSKIHPDDLTYFAYQSGISGGQAYGPVGTEYANTTNWAGGKSIELRNLVPDTDYYFVVKARNFAQRQTQVNESTEPAGNFDTNTVEVFFHTPAAVPAPSINWAASDAMSEPRADLLGIRLETPLAASNGGVPRFMVFGGSTTAGGDATIGDIYTLDGEKETIAISIPNSNRYGAAKVDGDALIDDALECRRAIVLGGTFSSFSEPTASAARYFPYTRSWGFANGLGVFRQSTPDMNEAVHLHAAVGIETHDVLRIGGCTESSLDSVTNTVERLTVVASQRLTYTALTSDFTVGATLTGQTSGCTGVIREIIPFGPDSGQLILSDVSTFFFASEEILDDVNGAAFAQNFSFDNGYFEKWDFVAPMLNKRFNHSAIVLDDGRVLVAGGTDETFNEVRDIEIYDPATNTWSIITGYTLDYENQTTPFTVGRWVAAENGAYGKVRIDDNAGATGTIHISNLLGASFGIGELLSDSTLGFTNKVGFFGPGVTITGQTSGATATVYATPEDDGSDGLLIIKPISGIFEIGEVIDDGIGNVAEVSSLPDSFGDGAVASPEVEVVRNHAQFPLVKLQDGRVLLLSGGNIGDVGQVDIFDPMGPDTVSQAADLPEGLRKHTAHVFGDGQVGVFGGEAGGGPTAACHLYDPVGDSWASIDPMAQERAGHVSFLLPNNTVLVLGGVDIGGNPLDSAEISGP